MLISVLIGRGGGTVDPQPVSGAARHPYSVVRRIKRACRRVWGVCWRMPWTRNPILVQMRSNYRSSNLIAAHGLYCKDLKTLISHPTK
jgi:hypothetical protein